jgi:hypothetical protein
MAFCFAWGVKARKKEKGKGVSTGKAWFGLGLGNQREATTHVFDILLVRKDQEADVAQLVVVENTPQLFTRFVNARLVRRVHNFGGEKAQRQKGQTDTQTRGSQHAPHAPKITASTPLK